MGNCFYKTIETGLCEPCYDIIGKNTRSDIEEILIIKEDDEYEKRINELYNKTFYDIPIKYDIR